MAYPQGINFRSTLGYVTDGANEAMATANTFAATYPVTTAQGNTVGWEGPLGNIRDRTTANDRRLAGVHFTATTQTDFRFDLPAAGSYNIRLAAGDAGGVNQANWLLVDGTTVLVTMASGTNGSGNSFRDATNTLLTAAAWPGSNTAITQTFATTICRVRSTTTGNDAIAHAYVEAAGGGTSVNPGAAALVLTGYAPSIAQPQTVSPSPAALALTGYAPAISQPHSVSPTPAAIVLTGYAPTISQALTISPTPAALVMAGYAPGIAQPHAVNPAAASIVLTGYAPTVSQHLPVAAPNVNGTTIMRASVTNNSVPRLVASIAASGGIMRASAAGSTIMRASPINSTGRMSNSAINCTANLL